jgi:Trk K+ transport system NAD-binding subunit
MNMLVIIFLLALTLSLIIIRVGTMALMLTGLSRETARFQAHSIFTGVGFTTLESESIVEHPVRRHITMALMMLGRIGVATVIATLTATLLSEQANEQLAFCLFLLSGGVLLLWVLAKSNWVERLMNRPIAVALNQFSRLDVRDYVSLLKLSSGFAVYELLVESNDWLAGKTLVEVGLAREGVLVLGIGRHNGNYIGAPAGNSQICAGDALVIYGPLERVEELDSRSAGVSGDQAHAIAAQQYDDYLSKVQQEDTATTTG